MRSARIAVAFLSVVAVAGARPAFAQHTTRSFEVAAQTTLLRLSNFGQTNAGLGGRASFDLSRWAAIEADVNFTPRDTATFVSTSISGDIMRTVYHRRRTDILVGAKLGARGERLGVFARVRPGFVKLTDKGLECVGTMCALALFMKPEYHTELAFDLGGTAEFYPSARTVARVDLGDLMIRHDRLAPPCSACTTHNFTSRFGIGFRF